MTTFSRATNVNETELDESTVGRSVRLGIAIGLPGIYLAVSQSLCWVA